MHLTHSVYVTLVEDTRHLSVLCLTHTPGLINCLSYRYVNTASRRLSNLRLPEINGFDPSRKNMLDTRNNNARARSIVDDEDPQPLP
jgi:hypothetical protein